MKNTINTMGNVSAYFGNIHVILTFRRDGAPRRVRLHPESPMTMTGRARASDRLANELEQWTGAVTLAVVNLTSGAPIVLKESEAELLFQRLPGVQT